MILTGKGRTTLSKNHSQCLKIDISFMVYLTPVSIDQIRQNCMVAECSWINWKGCPDM
jgi:hypothetical protein